MNYYEQDDREGRKWGIIGLVLYCALCVGLMFVTYRVLLPQPSLGILVDFGTTDTGSGDTDLANSQVDARPVSPQRQSRPEVPVMTTDDPTAPAVVAEQRPQTQPARQVEESVPQREVNQRALFPGRTEGSTATSQGTAGGVGNQGSEEGGPNGSDSAGGSGSSGISDVPGRYVIGNLPTPLYNSEEQGRVIIEIVVDRDGKVTSAIFKEVGSTTNDGRLVKAATDAARKARFTVKEDQEIQKGTITYIFKQN